MTRSSRRSETLKRRVRPSGRPRSAAPRVVRFRMPSLREAVAPAVTRALNATRAARLDDDQRADLAVALSEALSNAAIHGNHLRPGTHVQVTVTVEPRTRAVIDVRDSGPGFDASAVSDPTEPTHLLATAGRGLFLMRRLASHVEYNASGNRVRLVMERRARRRTDRRTAG